MSASNLDDLRRRATASALLAVHEAVNDKSVSPVSPLFWLDDGELEPLVDAAMYGWIKTHAEHATAEGWGLEETLRQTSLDPQPWDEGAIAHVLPMLSTLPIDWNKPLSTWSKNEMTRFLLEAMKLVRTAMIARDVKRKPASDGSPLEICAGDKVA